MADKTSCKRARAIIQYLKLETRNKSWKEYVSTINITTPMSKIWARIGKMSGKYKLHTTPCLTRGNNLMTDPLQVANMLATHFESVSSGTNYSPNFLQVKARAESHQLDFSTDNALPCNSPITIKEVVGTLKQCRRTAAGKDGISYQMLLHMHDSAYIFLLNLFNLIWLQHGYPTSWRRATVLEFPKPNKPNTEATSYRPIALTSCISKLLEKIVNMRLVNYLETNSLLPPLQYGFRK